MRPLCFHTTVDMWKTPQLQICNYTGTETASGLTKLSEEWPAPFEFGSYPGVNILVYFLTNVMERFLIFGMLWNSFLFSCRRWHFWPILSLFWPILLLFWPILSLSVAYFVTSWSILSLFWLKLWKSFFPCYGIVSNFWQYIHPWSYHQAKETSNC